MREHTVFELMPNRFRLPLAGLGLFLLVPILLTPADKLYSSEELAEVTAQREKKAADEKLQKQVMQALHVCQRDQIMAQLNDPGSYRLHDYRPVFKDDDVMIVKVDYSAKNAFGGRVRSTHTCRWRFS